MFWDEAAETLERDALDRLKLERLRELVLRLGARVPYYRDALRDTPPPSSLDALGSLPFTTKESLRQHYPFGLLAVPRERVVRVHASSGTTGRPTVVAYTRGDMGLWGDVMARLLTAGSVSSSDVVHNAYGYGLFTGGLGFGLGSETVGAATVPVSGGNTARQLLLLEDFGASVLCATPSYALVLAEALEESHIGLDRLKLRVGFLGAEPWGEGLRAEIESRLGLRAFDSYGLSEIIGPGVAAECEARAGLHIFEDHFLPEVINPETNAPVGDGEEGELVITTLTKEALPLLRYRTRDRVRLDRSACSCGRTSVRMSKVLGRTDDMLIIRGVNVFPSQVEEALLPVEGLAPQYVLYVDRVEGLDALEVHVERAAATPAEAAGQVAEAARRRVESILGIRVAVRVVEPKALDRSEGKAIRVVDRRSGG